MEYNHVGYMPVPTTVKATLSLVSARMGDRLATAFAGTATCCRFVDT